VCGSSSSLTTHATPSAGTRGPKGAYYSTARTKKRAKKIKDPRHDFIALFEDDAQANSFLEEFKAADLQDDGAKQDAIIAASIQMGASARLLGEVFNVGWKRYKRIRDNRAKQVWFYDSILLGTDSLLYYLLKMLQKRGGLNGLEITPAMHQDIRLFLNSLKQELSYPCSHRRLKTYIIEEGITTLKQVHERYMLFTSPEIQPKPRKIALTTFLKVILSLTQLLSN
jgi:hypothetical protein